jgi:hypothetical protein
MNVDMQGFVRDVWVFVRDVWVTVFNGKRVWLAHVIVNALLLISFFFWTQIPEENAWLFSLTLLSGLVIAFVGLWLHSATFDYFGAISEPSFKVSLRRSVRHVPAFLVWSLIFGLVLWLIGQFWNYDEQLGGWARHLLPSFWRGQVAPGSMISASQWLVWFLYFILWPIVFLPAGGQVATKGFRGFYGASAFRPLRQVRFWIMYLICFVVGACIPYALAWMTPTGASSLSVQTWSMVLRLGFGYLLLVTGWLLLFAAIMRVSDGKEKIAKASDPAPITASVS